MEHHAENTHGREKASSTMVEGLMRDHTVTSQSRSDSLIFRGPPATTTLQSLNDGNTAAAGTKDTDDVEERRRVSMTLSEYFATDFSPSPVAPGDFGWFTPCASGASIDDISPSARQVRYTGRSLTSNAHGSAENTASLSPSSLAGRTASRDAVLHEGSDISLSTRGVTDVLPEEGQLAPARTGGASSAAVHTSSTAEEFGDFYSKLHSQHEATTGTDHSSSVRSGIASRGAGASSSIGGVAAGSCLQGAVFPISRRMTNRIAEINQWHTQHRGVSCSGPMDVSSRCKGSVSICIMHIRRSSFAISTRHFPEKPVQTQVVHTTRLKEGDGVAGRSIGGTNPDGSSMHRGSKDGKMNAATATGVRYCAEDARGLGLSSRIKQNRSLRKAKSRSYAWALTEIRVVTGAAPWDPARAEYLVVASLGRGRLVAGWRRASDFQRLANVARKTLMSKVSYILPRDFAHFNARGFFC